MKPGAELDALVAEKVMKVAPLNAAPLNMPRYPHYSTNIAAAWEVVNHLIQYEGTGLFNIEAASGPSVCARFGPWPVKEQEWRYAESAPHAICLAALKACGVKTE